MASRCCCLASRYCRIAGVTGADICLKSNLAAMRVLALDTTTGAGSVALVEDDRIVDQRGGDAARTHAERLPGEITAIADKNRVPLSEVDLYGVASGPGSFTGLRIGIATIQGLAFVHGRRIV